MSGLLYDGRIYSNYSYWNHIRNGFKRLINNNRMKYYDFKMKECPRSLAFFAKRGTINYARSYRTIKLPWVIFENSSMICIIREFKLWSYFAQWDSLQIDGDDNNV